jgi:hypothetical protein
MDRQAKPDESVENDESGHTPPIIAMRGRRRYMSDVRDCATLQFRP